MGFIKFSKSEDIKSDSKTETTVPNLSRMQKGSSVDFGNKTYTVTAYNEFDWGEGFITQEWELSNSSGTKYLEREIGDEVIWILSDKAENAHIKKILKQKTTRLMVWRSWFITIFITNLTRLFHNT